MILTGGFIDLVYVLLAATGEALIVLAAALVILAFIVGLFTAMEVVK